MKPNTKKILKISSLSIATAGLVGLIVGVSNSWNDVKTINGGGSSAVLPLINDLGNNYLNADVVATAGGSGVGISSILTNTKEFGMASKNPNLYSSNNDDLLTNDQKKWKNIRAKTITIAWDGIVILYKSKDQKNIIDVNEQTLGKIYEAFSGIKQITFNDLDPQNEDKTMLIPFARNGGATTSGTADAFLNDSHININWEGINKNEVEDILKNGSYQGNVQQTAESNSQTWKRIKDSSYGVISYLSTGFVLNNYQEIIDSGFQVMTYKNKNLIENNDPSKHNITHGYNWYRPFNILVSLNEIANKEYIKNFINWILFDEQAKKIINDSGYVSLNNAQIESMIQNNDDSKNKLFIKSDFDLHYCGAKAEVSGT